MILIRTILILIHFNSIKVRLELENACLQFRSQLHFNSIKVRLEPIEATTKKPIHTVGLWVQRYKKYSEKCRCLKIFFLRSYDNLPIYGGFNKSKSTFGGFA